LSGSSATTKVGGLFRLRFEGVDDVEEGSGVRNTFLLLPFTVATLVAFSFPEALMSRNGPKASVSFGIRFALRLRAGEVRSRNTCRAAEAPREEARKDRGVKKRRKVLGVTEGGFFDLAPTTGSDVEAGDEAVRCGEEPMLEDDWDCIL
jgi:hypothetical protein